MLDQVATTPEEPELITGQPEPSLDELTLLGRRLAESHRQDMLGLQAAQVSPKKNRPRLVAQPGDSRPVSERISQFTKLMKEVAGRLQVQTSNSGELPTAAEWLLDNYYVVAQTLREVEHDLPPEFESRLPQLASGHRRIYDLAWEIIRRQKALLDLEQARRLLQVYQESLPLGMGELWAFPIMLRLGELECLLVAAAHLSELPDEVIGTFAPDWDFAHATSSSLEINDHQVVENSIRSLHTIATYDWKQFIESSSLVESILRQDPAHIYAGMDFETRDRYRKAVEEISIEARRDEVEITRQVLSMAQVAADRFSAGGVDLQSTGQDIGWDGFQAPVEAHVGYYLLGDGRAALERWIGYRPRFWGWLRRVLRTRPTLPYLGSIALMTLVIVFLIPLYAFEAGKMALPGAIPGLAFIFLLTLVPALTVAVDLVNLAAVRLVSPLGLSRMEFSHGLPQGCTTLVVIPSLLSSASEIDDLLEQIEKHYLSNPDPRLFFALLTDFVDAPEQHLPEDDGLVQRVRQGIMMLNEKYRPPATIANRTNGNDNQTISGGRFALLHRERQWNASEGVWMGWERKRGKLHELNQLILAAQDGLTETQALFPICEGDLTFLKQTRYVITLDADTILPRDAACELVATLAHPLNRAVFKASSRMQSYGEQVASGYTILQPRTEINPSTSGESLFTRIFSGDTGLDLYTRAVSDVYQDLFGEGIYVGKGIYEVRSFDRSLKNCIPENALLSHDLFEGIHGRAALVTDIILIEDLPATYLAYIRRQRRWWRGDWQLLPWLFSRRLSVISRWKIIDNLRRSLVPPVLLLWLALGWTVLPGSPWVWTISGVLALAVPALSGFLRSVSRLLIGRQTMQSGLSIRHSFLRWLLALVFLPYEAWLATEAILSTLLRLTITHRGLLKWTTSNQVTRLFGNPDTWSSWRLMWLSTVLTGGLTALIALYRPLSLGWAAPLLVAWLVGPGIATWISRPLRVKRERLKDDQLRDLHRIARRTWLFFEQFTGPEDHWLPPDHFQESPLGNIAHHTSPTNIGLMLLSTLGAYDLGYIETMNLLARLQNAVEALEKLERYRGHLLNWYDTRSLEPLPPRYVSTVDSGNLAASLVALREGCLEIPRQPVLRWESFDGLLDMIDLLDDLMKDLRSSPIRSAISELRGNLKAILVAIRAAKDNPEQWHSLFLSLRGVNNGQRAFKSWNEINQDIAGLVSSHADRLSTSTLQGLRIYNQRVQQQLGDIQRAFEVLLPWYRAFRELPAPFQEGKMPPDLVGTWHELLTALPSGLPLAEINGAYTLAREALSRLAQGIEGKGGPDWVAARRWIQSLDKALSAAAEAAQTQVAGFEDLARRCEAFFQGMDFSFLFNLRRQVFHIGYNVNTGSLDVNFYDLLASEARLASLVAIGKGDIPQSHWLYLSRPFTQVDGKKALISWSATMFEYLMPSLFLGNSRGTLMDQTLEAVVERQIAYGREKKVPWGISESGYYRFDQNQNYQYRAFGVPGLGYKRGLADDLVITPYASFLALPLHPRSAMKNASHLRQFGMQGLFGFYEAVDYTPARLPDGQNAAIVFSYMSHHQGMILMALINYLQAGKMIGRFQKDLRVKSVELLLQERIPRDVPIEQLTAEDLPGLRRSRPRLVSIPWQVDPYAPQPRVHCLSNGRYSLVVTAAGGSYSTWEGIDLTRWRTDPTLGNWGTWIYIQDRENHDTWSVSLHPTMAAGGVQETFFNSYNVRYQRRDSDLAQSMEVFVAPDQDVEIRLVTLINQSNQPRLLRLVSYGEVILSAQADDIRHPAFNKMFIESEMLPGNKGLLFHRRLRSETDAAVYLAHTVVVNPGGMILRLSEGSPPELEPDRGRFLGRDRNIRRPAFLDPGASPGGESSLDPIFSISQDIDLPAHSTVQAAFLTAAARSAEGCQAILDRYKTLEEVKSSLDRARVLAEVEMNEFEITSDHLKDYHILLSSLLVPSPALRASQERLAANQKAQPGLWPFAISGDFPILLVQIKDEDDLELVSDLLKAHRYWRKRRIPVDLVFMDEQSAGYDQTLGSQIYNLIVNTENAPWLDRRGGIFMLHGSQMDESERLLLEVVARVVLDSSRGNLAEQLQHIPGFDIKPPRLPVLTPQLPGGIDPEATPPLDRPQNLLFDNGLGGYSPDGREYCIYLTPGQSTPAPWINVIANPQFGFLTSETGLGVTWAENSGENRLTPWGNDPVLNAPAEALFLRDEETALVWSPTPLPAADPASYLIRHGAGYSIFEHRSHGLSQRLRVFSPPDDPLKILQLRLENTWGRVRRITITYYVEWVLGVSREATQQYLIPEYDGETQTLLIRNPYSIDFGRRVGFVAASKPLHGLTADRTEFLGRLGSLERPAALARIGLAGTVQPGLDPCSALQLHIDLPPGASEEVFFILGQGQDRDAALAYVQRYRQPMKAEDAWESNRRRWDEILGAVQVQTPEPSFDVLLNRWLLYQTLACRIWGRTAFYQSSGAYGFRDQLQDVLAMLHTAPQLAREHLLRAARHQFAAGDVLHWWHPPFGRGVRTRFSDDLLWLPFVTAEYVRITGDEAILAEKVPFRQAPLLEPDKPERYGLFPETGETYSLFEHCRRALERGATLGPHNLPLIGSGDWNDGMNRVGSKGRGESIWLGWFLYATLNRFADLCQRRGLEEPASGYRLRAADLAQSIEQSAWDGEWYLRAFYDDGTPLGSSKDLECQIDSIAQSWAVLSGGGDPRHKTQSMRSVFERLVKFRERQVLLFTPPFDKTSRDPGYIKAYPPGVRENGGQYTHAALWSVWALLELGWIDSGFEIYQLLNPILHSDAPEKVAHYRVEPYVVAADVYSASPFDGQGGWTWYTGSSGWMYRLGLEGFLGLKKQGTWLELAPCIPHHWPGFRVTYRFGAAVYDIQVDNPTRVSQGVQQVILDGQALPEKKIPLLPEAGEHQVSVIMG